MNAPGLVVGYSGGNDYQGGQYGQGFESLGSSLMSKSPPIMIRNYPRLGVVPPSAAGAVYLALAQGTGNMLQDPSGLRITPRGSVPNLMAVLTGQPSSSVTIAMQKRRPPHGHD